MPELFSGHPRDAAHPFPAIYPQANSPQAWSASATFSMLESLLGLYPLRAAADAPRRSDPHLPEWLPDIALTSLHR